MKQSIKKFLTFNGRNIYFLAKDGQYWIALKPICESLKVSWKHQLEMIKKDNVLGGAYRNHGMHDSSGRIQEMTSLPEFYVYGWLFSINSDSEELKEYKWKCYELLYDYFHGAMAERMEALQIKTQEEINVEKLAEVLKRTPEWKNLQEAKQKVVNAKSVLVRNDEKLMSGQTFMFLEN